MGRVAGGVSRCVNIHVYHPMGQEGLLIEAGNSTIPRCVCHHLGNTVQYEAVTLKVQRGDKGRNRWAPHALGSVSAQFRNAESHVYKHLFLICSIPLAPCLILSPSRPLFRPPCLPLCAGAGFWSRLNQNRV